ncbi:MAG: HTTM domain-containing protein [Minicystis sp.]
MSVGSSPDGRGTWRRALEWIFLYRGSTRPVALLRIATAIVLWSKFAPYMTLWSSLRTDRFLFSVSFYASTVLMLLGLKSRLASAWSAIAGLAFMLYGGLGLGLEEVANHHTSLLLLTTAFLAMTPCGHSYSVDRWRAVRAAEREGRAAPEERGDLWATRLLMVLITIVYAGGVWAKLSTPGYLNGAEMEKLMILAWPGGDDISPPLLRELGRVGGLLVLLAEIFIPVGLWWPRTRKAAVAVGVILHLVFYVVVPVQTFSVTMILLYLAFVPADDVHRVIDRLSGLTDRPAAEGGARSAA